MTFAYGKSLIHCVAFSTLFVATAAHAGNSFNKFPAQPTTSTSASVKAPTPRLKVQPVSAQPDRALSVKRIVQPTTPTPLFTADSVVADMNPTQSGQSQQARINRFNKMQDPRLKPQNRMPVVFSHNVSDAR
jgi:hypothetical protein